VIEEQNVMVEKGFGVSEFWVGFPTEKLAVHFLESLEEPSRYRVVEVRAFGLLGKPMAYLVLPTEVQVP
jgi:hypothetical protein